ncbi:MAG: hypothetical protein ACK5L3_08670 [Oscillospiraceae bacterium]
MKCYRKIVRAGDVIEVTETCSSRLGKHDKKAPRQNPTPLEMQKVNDEIAEATLRHLMFCNFKPGDWHCVLTYRREDRPTPQQSKANLQKFIEETRKYFRKSLGKEFKYIHTTEYEASAIHHHIVIEGVDIRPLQKIWRAAGGGMLRGTPINDLNHITNLAYYLIKETKNRYDGAGRHVRRWAASKNLKRPTVKRTPIKKVWNRTPQPYKGYYLQKFEDGDVVKTYENPLTMAPCRFYRMLPNAKPEPKKKKMFEGARV